MTFLSHNFSEKKYSACQTGIICNFRNFVITFATIESVGIKAG